MGLPGSSAREYCPASGDMPTVGSGLGDGVGSPFSHPESSLPTLPCTRAWLGKWPWGQFGTDLVAHRVAQCGSRVHSLVMRGHRHRKTVLGTASSGTDPAWPVLSLRGPRSSRCQHLLPT